MGTSVVELKVRVTPEEREVIEKLAEYLYKVGKIERKSINETVRLAVRFTVNEILKALEVERLGGRS